MKLICPVCNARLNIADERIPSGGAWARCPKCSDRFFIPPNDRVHNFGQAADNPQPNLKQTDELARNRILARARAANGLPAPEPPLDFSPDMVQIVYPDLQPRPMRYNIAIAVLLAIPLVVLMLAFRSSSQVPINVPQAKVVTTSQVEDWNNEKLIKSDLISLRSKMIRRGRSDVGASPSGSESRVFYYYMDRLAPGACDEISYLEIKTSSPANGFTAVATCRENYHKKVEMNVHWPNQTAVISFTGYQGEAEMELLRPMKPKQEI